MRYFILRGGIVPFFLTLALLLNNLSATAQLCGYYYQKAITINGSRIVGGPHANFPVLISHTDPDLAITAGKIGNVNGFDIVFSDAGGNPLDFQLEQFDGVTGRIVAWVKIPSITNGTNVTIYINYGNRTITTNQSTTNTWSAGFRGIWHFNGNVNDASANNYTSTNNSSTDQTSGKIGNGRNFASATSWVELPTFPNLTTNFTISGWIYTSDRTRPGQRIFVDDVNNTGGYGLSLGDGGAGTLRFYSRTSNPVYFDTPALINNNTWYHVAAVADITGSFKYIYINGVLQGSGSYTNAWGTDAGNASIGGETSTPPAETGNRFDGRLDEIRISSNALSANWLLTEYRSQNQPTTTVGVVTAGDFYTVSATESSNGNPHFGFGDNVWNAYAYTGDDINQNVNTYGGYYVHNTLSFNSSDLWGINANPSLAPGYIGCAVTDDTHTVRYKRRGFPCGYYQIDIAGPGNINGHDDRAELFVNGVSVWDHLGCCDTHTGVWSGFLGPTTELEFRWRDNAGESYGRVTFTPVAFPNVSPPVTICAGTTTTLTASGGSNYDWSTNTTHLVAPYTNASVVVSPPGATPNSVQTYTVITTDPATGCTASNTVDVTINPLPTTAVTPTSSTFCGTGSLDVTATGANTYTWSPLTDITVTSPSGHTATLTPTTTTTYTVTGSNNCATNSATVTVTVANVTGDPTQFGIDEWNVYCYSGVNFDTYNGYYVTNSLDFDSRTVWNENLSPSSAPGYNGCPIPDDYHSYRYKRRGFPCGYYQLDIPNHDDYVTLYINGVNVFQQNSWYNNIYKDDVWQGYLDSNSEIEYTIQENILASHAGLAFIYLGGPQNGSESVWTGETDTNWLTSTNWCGGVPSSTVSAFIPPGVTNFPTIGAAAETLDLTIWSGATLTLAAGQSLTSYGNWTNDGTFTQAGTATVVFSGANPITLDGTSPLSFTRVTLNNSNPAAVTLTSDMTITNTLTFTNGDILTGGNMVIFNNNATATGMSNSSYVSGLVRKVGNDAFTFPVGKNGYYAPVSISAPGNVAYYFTAEYFNDDPDAAGFSATSLGPGLHHVSGCEYWTLERNPNPSSNEHVFLSWDSPRSCGVTSLPNLRVAGWNGSQWTNLNNGATTGNTTAGTVRSNNTINVNTYAVFTLASNNTSNPLPIELLEFKAQFVKNSINITWKTATELNNDFFTVEKSLDGKQWRKLATLDGAGTSTVPLSYSYDDVSPVRGIQYYRLIQTDFDGTSTTSNIISVNVDENLANDFIIYPNPTNDEVTVSIRVDKESFLIKLIDVHGRIVKEFPLENQNEITFTVSELPRGVYIVEVSSTAGTNRGRLVLD